jgi:hypothetical protein
MQFTRAIEIALIEKRGWEGYLKRGAHTLKCPEYQVSALNSDINHFFVILHKAK